jgi:hypothetical protein
MVCFVLVAASYTQYAIPGKPAFPACRLARMNCDFMV